jgi:D-psicose/D-tagatose/L-ribulose 3-epimerase
MKLAASNIAWDPSEDDPVAVILRQHGFAGVEVAPSKRWESPIDASKNEIAAYRDEWHKRGLPIVAMQALLFGRPDLQLFGPEDARRALGDYLAAIIELAHGLGARALVFGSPRNRRRGAMPLDEATDIAVEFFRALGAGAASRDCMLCIEPNPSMYDCDFINTTAEAVALCERIASPGVKVNGDVGAMAANEENPETTLSAAMSCLGHFHASEPKLAEVGDGPLHKMASRQLRAAEWPGWVSIEMRAPAHNRVETIAAVAERVSRTYR